MTPYSKQFLERALALLRKDGQERLTKDGQRLVIPVKEQPDLVHRKWVERNAANAEKQLGIPAELWIELTTAGRELFGFEKALEAMLLAGFAIGWVERGKAEGKDPPK
jgi:hypothetical protein